MGADRAENAATTEALWVRPSWSEYALGLAEAASRRSEDPWHKVGAVVLRADHSVAGTGYNGAPAGMEIDWTDRDTRKAFVIHAETNALRYVSATEARGGLLASTRHPCPACLTQIAAYGILTVVVPAHAPDLDDDRDWEHLALIAATLKITVAAPVSTGGQP